MKLSLYDYCVENNKTELLEQWNYEKNGNLKPTMITAGSNKKVWWICEKGHEWEAMILNRSHGAGCSVCANRIVLAGYNDLATTRPELVAQWHPELNGDLTPEMVTAGSTKKVWWRCEKGHEWQAEIHNRSYGAGCPICAGKMVISGGNDLATAFPDLVPQWHPELNGELTPQMATARSNKKVWWKCEKGHEWQASILNRSHGTGCPVCSGKMVIPGVNDLASAFPDLVPQWHLELNGELIPQMVTASSNKKVWWKCEKGHEWQAEIYNRTRGYGKCPVCRAKSRVRTVD